MADVFKTIFEMDSQGNKVLEELDLINSKYKTVNTSMREQENTLDKLVTLEKRLIQDRKGSTNPNQAIAYTNEIKKTQAQIKKLSDELKAVQVEEKKVGKEATVLDKQLETAFQVTSINALNTQLDKVETGLKDTGTAAQKAGTDASKAYVNPLRQIELLKTKLFELKNAQLLSNTQEEFDTLTKDIQETETEVIKLEKELTKGFDGDKVQSLRSQLKSLKADLANATDPEEIIRLSKAAGELTDRIQDANDAANVFATDSPFEAVGNGLGSVASKLANLDFAGAAQQSRLLVNASKQITFKETLTGIKQLGQTLFNVGKALLTNPLFLLGAAVLLIITNFDKLKNAGGLVGVIFKGIGDTVQFLIDGFFELTDLIGLTSIGLQKLNEQKIDKLAEQLDDDIKTLDRFSKAVKATGKDVEDIEKRKQQAIIESTSKQIKLLDEITKATRGATKEQEKQRKDLVNQNFDAQNDLFIVEQEGLAKRRDANKKYAEQVAKVFEDLNKRIKDLTTKNEEFAINFKTDGNEAQLKRAFDLRRNLENEDIEALKKKAQKEIKDQTNLTNALLKIDEISRLTTKNREQELGQQLLDIRLKNGQEIIERTKTQADKQIDIYQADQNASEFFVAYNRLEIQKKYYKDSIALLEKNIADKKALGLKTVEDEKALSALKLEAATEEAKGKDALNKIELADREKSIDAELANVQAGLIRRNRLQSTQIQVQIEAERSRLAAMIASGEAEFEAIQAQQNKILQLEKDVKKQRINEALDFTKQIIDAAIQATDQILAAKQKEVEGQIRLQEDRVSQAKDIAQDGNAELLEEEKKRLEALQKEREKYVRAQQALAVVELIANTAITVSKAAAEGGVAAGVTIAAALIALIGGLAAARSIASQAAYYDGGEFGGGYTGDGNPREESRAIGTKPYTYHKKEFIFNHEKTARNIDIFRDIHQGKLDLREMKNKAESFDEMKMYHLNKGADIFYKPLPDNNESIKQLESKFDDLIRAVVQQDRLKLNIDEGGIHGIVSRFEARQNTIKDLAK